MGKDILGTGFDFDIDVQLGAGAFVCGEETALMASIEGYIGEPKARPPYPAQSGLWGKPTNINNVKTWARSLISSRTALPGMPALAPQPAKARRSFPWWVKINNTGLIEVPMGITLRHLIEGIGGGIE